MIKSCKNTLICLLLDVKEVFDHVALNWQWDSSVHDVDYESFDSILFQIEVRRVKRSQFNTI